MTSQIALAVTLGVVELPVYDRVRPDVTALLVAQAFGTSALPLSLIAAAPMAPGAWVLW